MCYRLILIICLLTGSYCASAQSLGKKEIPALAQEDFELRFENPKGVVWKQDDAGYLGASFVNELPLRRVPTTVVYAADNGNWVQTREEAIWDQLPVTLQDLLTSKYLEYEMGQFNLLTTRQSGVFYEVELRENLKRLDLTFDMNGDLVEEMERKEAAEFAESNEEKKKWKWPKLGTKLGGAGSE